MENNIYKTLLSSAKLLILLQPTTYFTAVNHDVHVSQLVDMKIAIYNSNTAKFVTLQLVSGWMSQSASFHFRIFHLYNHRHFEVCLYLLYAKYLSQYLQYSLLSHTRACMLQYVFDMHYTHTFYTKKDTVTPSWSHHLGYVCGHLISVHIVI